MMTKVKVSGRVKTRDAAVKHPQGPAEATGAAQAAVAVAPVRQTKTALLRGMLAEPNGASLQSLMAATGWQGHTVRAALSGLRKSGVEITRTKGEDGAVYCIASYPVDPPVGLQRDTSDPAADPVMP